MTFYCLRKVKDCWTQPELDAYSSDQLCSRSSQVRIAYWPAYTLNLEETVVSQSILAQQKMVLQLLTFPTIIY